MFTRFRWEGVFRRTPQGQNGVKSSIYRVNKMQSVANRLLLSEIMSLAHKQTRSVVFIEQHISLCQTINTCNLNNVNTVQTRTISVKSKMYFWSSSWPFGSSLYSPQLVCWWQLIVVKSLNIFFLVSFNKLVFCCVPLVFSWFWFVISLEAEPPSTTG